MLHVGIVRVVVVREYPINQEPHQLPFCLLSSTYSRLTTSTLLFTSLTKGGLPLNICDNLWDSLEQTLIERHRMHIGLSCNSGWFSWAGSVRAILIMIQVQKLWNNESYEPIKQ